MESNKRHVTSRDTSERKEGVKIRDQAKGRKTLFLPKISAEISAETLSVIILLSAYLQKELLLAERAYFGRKTRFRQGRYILVVYCYPTLWPKTLQPVSKWHDILQKDTVSAERLYFGRKRHYRQNISFGRNS